MKAIKLYKILEKDFIKPGLSDDWARYMGPISDFLSENFKKRSMGLVCDFAQEINKVYTAVFPSEKVMQYILNMRDTNAMLFVHHPSIWDIRKAPEIFEQMDKMLLQKFKENRISIYNLHVPLDNYGKYSTGASLAKVLGIKIEKPFAPYFGGLSGVIGKTKVSTISELKKEFDSVLGHKSKLYNYGQEKINNNRIAMVTGGGNNLETMKELIREKINIFITGITAKNEHSKEAHDYAEKNKINILGGTHYSTEKFACIALCQYFKKLGLESEFIPDVPIMEDL